MSKFLARLTDAMVLRPSRRPLSAGAKQRHLIDHGEGHLEIWTHTVRCHDPSEAALFVLKFGGTSGRAERSTHAPFDQWSGLKGCVWSVNPPGYGGSSGRATLSGLPSMADAAYEAMREVAGDRPIVITGNSLGAVSALYLARIRPVAGLVLRNPPPLRELILGRFGWWNLWLGARLIADQIPEELCSIGNASGSKAPAVIVTSRRDRIVPRKLQRQIFQSYGGPKRLLTLRRGQHHTPMNPSEQAHFGRLLRWLRQELAASHSVLRTEPFGQHGVDQQLQDVVGDQRQDGESAIVSDSQLQSDHQRFLAAGDPHSNAVGSCKSQPA